jgi:hypothetical protein
MYQRSSLCWHGSQLLHHRLPDLGGEELLGPVGTAEVGREGCVGVEELESGRRLGVQDVDVGQLGEGGDDASASPPADRHPGEVPAEEERLTGSVGDGRISTGPALTPDQRAPQRRGRAA